MKLKVKELLGLYDRNGSEVYVGAKIQYKEGGVFTVLERDEDRIVIKYGEREYSEIWKDSNLIVA